MKNPPISFDPELFDSLDTGPLVDELISAARDHADGKASRTLWKSPELTVVLIALRAGTRMAEHAAPGPVLIVPLKGHASFTGPASKAPIAEKHVLAMSAGMRHEVVASDDAAFMLVIGSRSS